MNRIVLVTLVVAMLLVAIVLSGCPKQQETVLQGAPPTTAPPTPPTPPAAAPPPPGTHEMPGGKTMSDKDMKNMPADTAATNKEDMASCPVLGTTMAKKDMIPYDYKGKTYYFCCNPCVEKFKQDPEKYIKNPHAPLPPGEGMKMGG